MLPAGYCAAVRELAERARPRDASRRRALVERRGEAGRRAARDRAGLRFGLRVPVEGSRARRSARCCAAAAISSRPRGAGARCWAAACGRPESSPRPGATRSRNNIARLAEDHENAARLGAGLAKHAELTVAPAQTNMVFVAVPRQHRRVVHRAPRGGGRSTLRHDPAALVHASRCRAHRRRYRDCLRRPVLREARMTAAIAEQPARDFGPTPGVRSPAQRACDGRAIRDASGANRAERWRRDGAVDLQLTGMTCAACAARIEKVLNRVGRRSSGGQLRHRDRARRIRCRQGDDRSR